NATSQTITVAASQAGSYTVRVISGTCTSQSSLPTVVTDASNPVISGGITGSTAVQPGSTHTYSVSPVTGATSYSWEFEGSGTITGSGATVSITFGTQSGTLIVQAETPCGTSEPAYIDVDIASASVTDLAISSNQSISGTYNNVTITGSPTVTLSGDLTVQGNITVPDGATFNTNCHNVTGSGTFTLQAGGTLKVCNTAGISASGSTGAVQTAGRSFSNDANYEYLGIAAQLTGSGLPGKVRNLTVNNEYNVSLSNPVSVSRVLDLKLGFLFTNDQLTLLSDAGGTAMVINNVGRTIGTAKVQRYITATVNSGTGYRHYSSPVVNQSLSGLTSTSGNFTPMLNTDYNTAARPGSVTPFPNVFTFDESRISTQHDTFSLGWKVPTGIMETCRGYSVNIGANQTLQVSGDLVNAETSVDFTGGSANNSGWLLAGNPYPSPIDWNLVQADLGGQFENAIYTAQSTGQYAGRYGSYVNGVANNGGSRYLASMQGFFMRANLNNSGTLFFQNTHRVTTYMNPSFYRTESRADLIRLQLSAAGSADDETVIYFENDAFGGFDKDKDAGKVHAGGMSLYSLNGSEHFSINCLPSEMLNSSNTRVRLAYASVAEGIHTLSALESDANWFIFDHTDSRLHAMPYSFSTAKGRFENRLELVRINTVSGISTAGPQLSLHPNPSNGSLQLSLPGQSQINIYDAAGRLMQSSEMNNMRTLDISAFPAGVYMLHCTGAGNSSVHKVVKQ
ncbi:MAG: T9SS type A sorting domain-containing protein, partial [Bacteroidota bacterium]